MIKNLGGVFGRNPTFNDVEVQGDLTVDGDYVVSGDLDVTGNATITGTLGVTGQITLEDASLNTTLVSQDHTASEPLKISSYYAGSSSQFLWAKNTGGSIISVGDLDSTNFAMNTTWDCDSGTITTIVEGSSISIDSSVVDICGVQISNIGDIASDAIATVRSLTASQQVKGATLSIGASFVIQGTATLTTTSTSQVTLLSLSSVTYSSVKYFVQARNTTTSRYQITEIVATRNATTTVVTATPVDTNSGGVAVTYAVDISASTFRLQITPQAASSTVFKVLYTAMP